MKCPKCGYHSFEYLANCKKCGHDLNEHKAKYNLRELTIPGTAATVATATTSAAPDAESIVTVDSEDNESIDFGFDFLEEDQPQTEEAHASVALGGDDQEINLDQPFDVDSETVPADTPADEKDKPDKGPEFAF